MAHTTDAVLCSIHPLCASDVHTADGALSQLSAADKAAALVAAGEQHTVHRCIEADLTHRRVLQLLGKVGGVVGRGRRGGSWEGGRLGERGGRGGGRERGTLRSAALSGSARGLLLLVRLAGGRRVVRRLLHLCVARRGGGGEEGGEVGGVLRRLRLLRWPLLLLLEASPARLDLSLRLLLLLCLVPAGGAEEVAQPDGPRQPRNAGDDGAHRGALTTRRRTVRGGTTLPLPRRTRHPHDGGEEGDVEGGAGRWRRLPHRASGRRGRERARSRWEQDKGSESTQPARLTAKESTALRMRTVQ